VKWAIGVRVICIVGVRKWDEKVIMVGVRAGYT